MSASIAGSRNGLNVSVDNHLNRGPDHNLHLPLPSSPDDHSIAAFAEIRHDVPSRNYSPSNISLDVPVNRIGKKVQISNVPGLV